jgi:hypothetical protein
MTTVTTRTVEYPADGLTMIGHLALPTGVDRRPAVLLGPEGTGLDDVQRRRADNARHHKRSARHLADQHRPERPILHGASAAPTPSSSKAGLEQHQVRDYPEPGTSHFTLAMLAAAF